MALAYGNFHELSHQIRFLLFEIGIGLPQNSIDYFITLAHRNALKRLHHAAIKEKLLDAPIASHHVHDLIDQLQVKLKTSHPASQFFKWQNMHDDLDESIANDALAQAYKQCWNTQIRNEALHHNSLWSWVNDNQTSYQTLLFLEQWGCMGSTYHPTFRAKKGFTRREVLQNSPEFQAKIRIHWCALRKDKAFIPIQSDTFLTQIADEFPTEYALWRERLIFNHLDPDNYYPIPVHPWQWRNHILPMCAPMIDKKHLILIAHHQSVIPSMSFDTMLPLDSPRSLIHLTTSINIPETQCSNSSTLNYGAPGLVKWVTSLLFSTNNYDNSLFLANRLTTIGLQDPDIPEHKHKLLAASFYQNPIELINKNQKLVPLTSLFAHSPITNTPLLVEIIKASGLAPLPYFALYCYKVLSSSVQLFLKQGLVLETYEHNILVIFEENKPQGLILKDLTDIKISSSLFSNTAEHPALPTAAPVRTINLDELRISFIQNTLQNNINRWVNLFNTQYQLPTTLLWSEVHQILNKIFNQISNDGNPGILEWQKMQLLHEAWQYQCLFTMKLYANPIKNVYITEKNPLI